MQLVRSFAKSREPGNATQRCSVAAALDKLALTPDARAARVYHFFFPKTGGLV